MLNRITTLLYTFFLFLCTVPLVQGQTIVSTAVETRTILMEQYGGINCPNCATANETYNNYVANNADKVIPLSIHAGIYAAPDEGQPDYRIPEGTFFSTLIGWTGSPAYTINRHNFPGYEQGPPGSLALSHSLVYSLAKQEMDKDAIINIAAEASLDYDASTLDIYVETYYTSAGQAEDYLNIALIQNNIYGPQQGVDGGYIHQYLLRDVLTPVEGEPILNTDQGSFESNQYSFELPDVINGVDLNFADLELVVFVTDSINGNILNSHKLTPTYQLTNENDAAIFHRHEGNDICGEEFSPQIEIQNNGSNPLTSLAIEYGFYNQPTTIYAWQGYLAPLESIIVDLPHISTVDNQSNFFIMHAILPNGSQDEDTSDNHTACVIANVPSATNQDDITLLLKTDNYGYETYWEIVNENEEIVAYGGNTILQEYGGGQQVTSSSDPNAYDPNFVYEHNLTFTEPGCYQLNVYDDFGDGICCSYGNGFYYLTGGDDFLIQGGQFIDKISHQFTITAPTVSTSATLDNKNEDILFSAYPNPAENDIFVETNTSLEEITLYDFNAKKVGVFTHTQENLWHMNVAHLEAGTYFARGYSQSGVFSSKIVIIPNH